MIELRAEKHFTLDELISAVHSGNEKERIEGLRIMLDAGKIKTDGEKYYI